MIHWKVLKSSSLHLSYTQILVCRCGGTLVVDFFSWLPIYFHLKKQIGSNYKSRYVKSGRWISHFHLSAAACDCLTLWHAAMTNKPSSQFQSVGRKLFCCFPQACRLYNNSYGICQPPQPWFSSCNSLKWFHIWSKAAILLDAQTRVGSDLIRYRSSSPLKQGDIAADTQHGWWHLCMRREVQTLFTPRSIVCVCGYTALTCKSHQGVLWFPSHTSASP